jgi:hypothetical protein
MDASSPPTIDIEALGFDRGAHLLIKHALACVPVGATLRVLSYAPEFHAHVSAWCRAQGHTVGCETEGCAHIVRGGYQVGRWRDAERCGRANPRALEALAEHAEATWGLAARGAWSPKAIAVGFERVRTLKAEMAEGRRLRLGKLGFEESVAARLVSLHTRNFM